MKTVNEARRTKKNKTVNMDETLGIDWYVDNQDLIQT